MWEEEKERGFFKKTNIILKEMVFFVTIKMAFS